MAKKKLKSKKSGGFLSKLRGKRLFLVIVAVIFIVGGVISIKTTFAQTDIKVCNSSASARMIKVFKMNNETGFSQWRDKDQCTPWINNTGWNPVRVDTGSYGSYKLGKIGQGYGDCHEGRNYFSNPPDDNAPLGVRYRNYDIPHCDF